VVFNVCAGKEKIEAERGNYESLMNESAGYFFDYDRSESAKYSLSPKRRCFKVVVF
jgi:hypothetical protein